MPIHDILPSLRLRVKATGFLRTGNWWNWKNVNSPFTRLYLITGGSAYIKHHGREFHLEPGKLHLVPCFTFWSCRCEDWYDEYFVHFTSSLAGGRDLFTIQDYEYHLDAGEREVELFKRLVELNPDKVPDDYNPHKPDNKLFPRDLHEPDINVSPGTLIETDGVLRQLLAPVLHTGHGFSEPEQKAIKRFKDVLEFIDQNLKRTITLEELGEYAGLNPTYFSDIFFTTMGSRPIEYINRKRIEKSQYLLCASSSSIAKISDEVGFMYVPYFSRLFKKFVGVSPALYRKQHAVYT